MSIKPIKLDDWHRILIGDSPSLFLLEIVGRALIIYFVLLLAMRLMGRRIGAQLTQNELAVVVSLGAAIGVPMQAPDRGMLPAVIILAVAIAVQRGLNALANRREGVERVLIGSVITIVEDGRILTRELRATGLSRERLFSILRGRGYQHLGQIRRVYFESSGEMSVIDSRPPAPGLCILPLADTGIRTQNSAVAGQLACRQCGQVIAGEERSAGHCPRCGGREWESAFLQDDETRPGR